MPDGRHDDPFGDLKRLYKLIIGPSGRLLFRISFLIWFLYGSITTYL